MVRGYYVTAYHVLNGCRYKPPEVDLESTNIENSQNTALFLVSCFQYTLSAVVLSIGRPYREPMSRNLPFISTIFLALALSTYMLFDPADWVMRAMELTDMDNGFKIMLLALGLGNFGVAYVAEHLLLPGLAKWIGVLKVKVGGQRWAKRRKEYKVIQAGMMM